MSYVPFPLRGAGRRTARRLALAALAAAVLAVAADSAIVLRMGAGTPTGGDGPYFIGLAKSMAAGRGYRLERSYWPEQPHLGRSPLWPAILTVPALAFPEANENALLRFTGAALHGIAAALLVALTFQLTGAWGASALAGLWMAVYLPASGLVEGGYSELAFLAVMLAGIVLVGEGGKSAHGGALLCGVSVLARSNYILLPAALWISAAAMRRGSGWKELRPWIAGCVLFAVFPGLWVARNYAVSGRFPVLSAMEGETLYGANNARVATNLLAWGYWIMPNDIPGEKSKQELARTRSEMELDHYYHARAVEYLRANWYSLPRLMVGKLVRGFVPVPWVPVAASYAAFFCRLCVYAAFGAALFFWRGWSRPYAALLSAMFLVTVATTLVYYGTYRFTFCMEPFLFPAIAGAAVAAMRRSRGEPAHETASGTGAGR